ncbi:MAG: thioredoxin family protein [Polaribacter sp.]|uniref:thioredoxin family protein n=1 Tax=Polaribacter sp. TaxID=1920175 RepID=UPI0032676BA6
MRKTFLFFFILSTTILFSQKNDSLLSYSFEEAYKLQEKEKKPIVVFFHTNWCKFCFAMKKNTFTNKEIIKLLNEKFYFISFNAESKKPININGQTFINKSGIHQITEILASKKGTISYPSTIILSPKNTIDEQIDSFLSVKEIKKILQTYLFNLKQYNH